MRAACVDRQLIMPTAEQWKLQRGAYRDGQDLVLPVVDARVSIFLPVNRSVRELYWRPRVLVPGGGKNQLYEKAYYRGDAHLISFGECASRTSRPMDHCTSVESPSWICCVLAQSVYRRFMVLRRRWHAFPSRPIRYHRDTPVRQLPI